jgi:hypothetical protein
MFMQGVMVNRKLFGNFEFSAPLQKRSIFLLFDSLLFSLISDNLQKTETETKSRVFAVFAVICPFLSQIKR